MQNIKVKHSMSPKEVNDLVVKAFGVEGYKVLECDVSGHNLVKSSEQEMDGDAAVGRRGCLYLCEKFEVYTLKWCSIKELVDHLNGSLYSISASSTNIACQRGIIRRGFL